MLDKVLAALAGFIIAVISNLQYAGVALLMAIESACIPLPSEVILPFAGYLVYKGELSLWLVALAGAFGCLVGSLVAYAIGAWGGRPLAIRYGRFVLISARELDWADRWFQRHGSITIFIGRLLPIVRTFISLPAGVAKMPLLRFSAYTFLGSFVWSLALAWIGLKLGQHWQSLGGIFHRFDGVVLAVLVIGVAVYLWYRLRGSRAG